MKRMTHDEFFARVADFDGERLRQALWKVYWRGPDAIRERIEAEIDPVKAALRDQMASQRMDPDEVLDEVSDFAWLARSGAYIMGNRRVTPRERTRWRFQFQRLARETQRLLCGEDFEFGITAMERLVDLAVETETYYYFRSEDPLEAARFVVSDAVALLWTKVRDSNGLQVLAERALPQLIRWESLHGWTRSGAGSVAQKETPLTEILAGMLGTSRDLWLRMLESYLRALDQVASEEMATSSSGSRSSLAMLREQRTSALSGWHVHLLSRVDKADGKTGLQKLARHEAFDGPPLKILQARVALRYGDRERARTLVLEILRQRPGDAGAMLLAKGLDVPIPGRRGTSSSP